MRKQGKILTGVIGALCLVAGIFIGALLNLPPTDKTELAGTIGKINNYRNVKITENDLQLRNELLNDKELALQYNKYLSFHYLNSAQLTEELGNTLNAALTTPDFLQAFGEEIKALQGFENFLNEARKDILIAILALQHLSDKEQQSIGLLLNNANNAIAQINFKGQAVITIMDALETFFSGNDPAKYPELKKAHDVLLINQIKTAVASADKVKIKYLDKKEFLSSQQDLSLYASSKPGNLNDCVVSDFEAISDKFISDKFISDKMVSDKFISDKMVTDKFVSDRNVPELNSQFYNDISQAISDMVSSHVVSDRSFSFDFNSLDSHVFSDMANSHHQFSHIGL